MLPYGNMNGHTQRGGMNMKQIQPGANKHQWPRHLIGSVPCRKHDFVVRIIDWMKDKDEPTYDAECYIGGVYDWNESESFTLSSGLTEAQAKQAAIEYASQQIAKLL
jgi:hypothetical protein